jgi:transposase
LVKQEVEVQVCQYTVGVFHHGQRIASHLRSDHKGGHTTLREHMPEAHQSVHDWSDERFLKWANSIGSQTREVVSILLHQKRHPEQNYRSVLALLSNAKKYDHERLNNACGRASLINSPTRSSIESILKQGLDKIALETDEMTQEELALDTHENVRGEDYYH